MLVYRRADTIAGQTPQAAHVVFIGKYKSPSNHIKGITSILTETGTDLRKESGGERANQEFIALVLERVSGLKFAGGRDRGKAEVSTGEQREVREGGRAHGESRWGQEVSGRHGGLEVVGSHPT